MYKKIIFLFSFCFLISSNIKAQNPPNAFNYSAIARNSVGLPISSTTIGIQITIIKNSPSGASQYSENHFVKTDTFGLFNIVIGGGAIQSGSISKIDWSNDKYFLSIGIDIKGGTNFLAMGSTQLLSVPYALHAKTAERVVGKDSAGIGFTHYIGEAYGGGVIFHLWKDTLGVEHGLIVDKTDLSSSQTWSNIINASVATKSWDGLSNSNAIVSQAGHNNSAASLCLNSTNGGQNDWYLPSIDELSLLCHNRFNVNKTLSTISGAVKLPVFASYWSSTGLPRLNTIGGEYNASFFSFQSVSAGSISKDTAMYVRSIRAF